MPWTVGSTQTLKAKKNLVDLVESETVLVAPLDFGTLTPTVLVPGGWMMPPMSMPGVRLAHFVLNLAGDEECDLDTTHARALARHATATAQA